jgi:hypothetical protein
MAIVAAIVAAGSAIYGAYEQNQAATNATNATRNASDRATSLQESEWNQQQQQEAPWLAAGRSALPQMQRIAAGAESINPASDAGYTQKNSLTDPGQFSFNTTGPNADPSYQWRVDQGNAAVSASAAARGDYFSGATGTALQIQGQNMASQEYQDQFNRYQTSLSDYMNQEQFNTDQYNQAYNRQMGIETNAYNQFSTLAGYGQVANQQLTVGGQNYSTNVGNVAVNQGTNTANYSTSQGNTNAQLATNLSNDFTSAYGATLNQNQFNDMMNQWNNENASTTPTYGITGPDYSMVG